MNYLAQRNKVAETIAEIIFNDKANIRLDDESDNGVLEKTKGKQNQSLRFIIVSKYREIMDNKFTTEFDWSRLREFDHEVFHQLYEQVFEDLINHYSEFIDESMWHLQCKFEPQKYKSVKLDYAV